MTQILCVAKFALVFQPMAQNKSGQSVVFIDLVRLDMYCLYRIQDTMQFSMCRRTLWSSSFALGLVYKYKIASLRLDFFWFYHTQLKIKHRTSPSKSLSSPMAQQFLEQLLRYENVEPVGEAETLTCMICKETYGTINASTGAVELQIRLPCGHMLGSICISTWLSHQNSCPLCREPFFPPEQHQSLETRVENVSPPETSVPTIYQACDAEEICGWAANLLDFDSRARSAAISMCGPLTRMVTGISHTAICVAAISMYIAWHLFNENGDPAALIADLARETGVPEDYIRFRYYYLYNDRMELVSPEMFSDLARGDIDALNWPPRDWSTI